MHKNNREETGIREISLENLRIHPKNIRKEYNDIDELTASIREKGILQNLTVVPDPEVSDGYLVVIGNRRLTAARNAGLKTAPCRIVEDMPESEQVMAMLTENMQRSNLTVSEEAAGIQMCLSDFGFTIEDIAQKTGLSQTTVRHRANIAKLNQQVLRSKEADEGFQLNLTDLTRLEKVSNIATRNKILKEARDSKELAWKAQSAAEEEKRAKVTKKLVAMAKKEGIAPAPEGTDREMYSGKWNTVKEYSLT
ncbi:MAG: ParB/RepB/Spo0J family partition protein [Lachnospiraceae bacterium]|nr:ParB/RepB/Spo0J family partition protein [Lachnospiraceae bacterium]